MLTSFKKNIENSIFSVTKQGLRNSSNLTRPLFDSVHSNLIFRRFKRRYPQVRKDILIDDEYSKEIQEYWKRHLGVTITPAWHHIISSINGIKDTRYVPQEIWSEYIHNKLNPPRYHDPLIADKNALDLYISKTYLPKTVFKIINGNFFDASNHKISARRAKYYLFRDDRDKFVKPSRLYQGKGAFKIQLDGKHLISGKEQLSFEDFIQSVDRNSIVQYVVEQHPKIASVHANSLNTIRIFTIRLDSGVYYLNGGIKFGADNNDTDNTGNGVLCSIDKTNYKLANIAYNRRLETFTNHMNTGIEFGSFGEIPHYQDAIDLCKEVHKNLLYHDFAAWDVAISVDGNPIIVELNSKPSIFMWQIRFQESLFGDFTEMVLELIKKR